MDVSIILVSYNTKDLTRDCIKSIYDKTSGIEYEIFVVDNNSHDGSPEMIEKEFSDVHLIKNTENKGFGAANNIAMRQSSAKYIFCLNTDTLLVNNAVKIFFDFMEQNTNVGACGGILFNKEMQPVYSCGNFPSRTRIFFQFFNINKLFPKIWSEKYSPAKIITNNILQEVDYIIGADLFIRKSVLDTAGLYDEKIFMYGEESDLCFRIKKAGYKTIYNPDAKIIHLEGKSSESIDKRKISLTSLLYWYKKNISTFDYVLLKFFLVIRYKLFYSFTKNKDFDTLSNYIENISL